MKHYEDCEQLFNSVGRMYVIEAALTFFGMETVNDRPAKHFSSSVWLISSKANEAHFNKVINKFVNQFMRPHQVLRQNNPIPPPLAGQ